MDTRFWGPSGWQLYHMVAQTYSGSPTHYKAFFDTMTDILPCKFCRESTKQFVEKDPPDFTSKCTLTTWLYELHNKVNHKLRSQCKDDPKVICPPPDPSIEKVNAIYQELVSSEMDVPPGLDFLFCVVYNYNTTFAHSYARMFVSLTHLYPNERLRMIIKKYVTKEGLHMAVQSRDRMYAWWYALAVKLCDATGFPIGTLRGTLQRYGRFKSGCNRGKTCRNGKKIRDHAKTYKITHDRLVQVNK